MLQLKQLRLLNLLTGVPAHEIKPIKFGYAVAFSANAVYVLASQEIPANMSLCVLRVQSYMANTLITDSGYQLYRTVPAGTAWWIQASDTSSTAQANWTNPNAPSHLALDSDELLLFPEGQFANLLFDSADTSPAGTWQIRTTVYGYLVPPGVSDALGSVQDWINFQQ